MHLKTLSIKNFRAITNISVEFINGINVIVGPNAIGKTTVLDAIRLAKALLAQRVQSESIQTLLSLGAMSPHNQQQIIHEGLVQDISKPLEIRCGYHLSDSEIAFVKDKREQFVTDILYSRVAGNMNPASMGAYVSSPTGQKALLEINLEVEDGLKKLNSSSNICRLDLIIDLKAGRPETPDPIGAAIIAFIDRSLPPELTKFSYFPADRALPRGDVGIQIGAQDSAQILESHNSQPQLKYQRLKNTIFNMIISGNDGRKNLTDEFKQIFSGVLKGRELVGADINQYGLLSIRVKDVDTNRVFDIDGLSSGEKGLVLTFLLLSKTLEKESVVLLDEPELHLNPAVCKDLLSYLVDNYVNKKSLQLILCSHSPEILAGAFERDECELYHLISGEQLVKVRQSDEQEISEALYLLGTSESEGLLYKATIFVEGEHDIEILETGFGALLRQYKLKDLGGRNEIEKQIQQLQKAEKEEKKINPRFFIFDNDGAPSNLDSTKLVKILQWDRYCLENYLIDIDILSDILKDPEILSEPFKNAGDVSGVLKSIAIKQLDDVVIQKTYDSYNFPHADRRAKDIRGKSFEESGSILYDRINAVKESFCTLDKSLWSKEFLEKCDGLRNEQLPIWDARWKEVCDGKRLFQTLHSSYKFKLNLLSFKKRIISKMREHPPSDEWRVVESLLNSLITKS